MRIYIRICSFFSVHGRCILMFVGLDNLLCESTTASQVVLLEKMLKKGFSLCCFMYTQKDHQL